jgi:hypothetical protein
MRGARYWPAVPAPLPSHKTIGIERHATYSPLEPRHFPISYVFFNFFLFSPSARPLPPPPPRPVLATATTTAATARVCVCPCGGAGKPKADASPRGRSSTTWSRSRARLLLPLSVADRSWRNAFQALAYARNRALAHSPISFPRGSRASSLALMNQIYERIKCIGGSSTVQHYA